jgi:hypothetical protein
MILIFNFKTQAPTPNPARSMARLIAVMSASIGRRISPLRKSTESGAVPAPVAARVTAFTQPWQSMPVTLRMSSCVMQYSFAPCAQTGKRQNNTACSHVDRCRCACPGHRWRAVLWLHDRTSRKYPADNPKGLIDADLRSTGNKTRSLGLAQLSCPHYKFNS